MKNSQTIHICLKPFQFQSRSCFRNLMCIHLSSSLFLRIVLLSSIICSDLSGFYGMLNIIVTAARVLVRPPFKTIKSVDFVSLPLYPCDLLCWNRIRIHQLQFISVIQNLFMTKFKTSLRYRTLRAHTEYNIAKSNYIYKNSSGAQVVAVLSHQDNHDRLIF